MNWFKKLFEKTAKNREQNDANIIDTSTNIVPDGNDETSSDINPGAWDKANDDAMVNLTAKAEEGDVYSQRFLGFHFHEKGDYKQAAKWLLKASEQDDKEAQILVGIMADHSQGLIYLAEEGYADAQVKLNADGVPVRRLFADDVFAANIRKFRRNDMPVADNAGRKKRILNF
jgi:TPR repeat protein